MPDKLQTPPDPTIPTLYWHYPEGFPEHGSVWTNKPTDEELDFIGDVNPKSILLGDVVKERNKWLDILTDRWHRLSKDDRSQDNIWTFMGLTEEQYKAWVRDPSVYPL